MASFGYHHDNGGEVLSPIDRLKKKAADAREAWNAQQLGRADKRVEEMIALLAKSDKGVVHIDSLLNETEKNLLKECGIYFKNFVSGGSDISFMPFPVDNPPQKWGYD